MTNNIIQIYRGDSLTLEVTVRDADGVLAVLTGAKIYFTVKKSTIQATADFQRKNLTALGDATQIADTDLPNGSFEIYIIPENTSGMSPAVYYYDCQVIVGGKTYTVLKDKFVIKTDVTT